VPEIDKNGALINVADKLMSLGLPFAHLSAQEQVFVAIWELEGDVNNGGFHQYFFNTSGDTAKHAAPSLEAIGAAKMAAIVREALQVFGPPGPSAERDIRQEQLADLSPSALETLERLTTEFFRYPDNLTELLFAYVARHKPAIRGASDAL
jgi:Domain of unknown function (DUF4375)